MLFECSQTPAKVVFRVLVQSPSGAGHWDIGDRTNGDLQLTDKTSSHSKGCLCLWDGGLLESLCVWMLSDTRRSLRGIIRSNVIIELFNKTVTKYESDWVTDGVE